MKSNELLNVMVKDHNRLMNYLKDVKNNLESELLSLSVLKDFKIEKI